MSGETLKRPSFIQSNPVLRTPTLYGHLIITDSLLCPWGKKAITLSLKSTRSIWTPRKYGHFLWPSQCPYYRAWLYFIKISSPRNSFLWHASPEDVLQHKVERDVSPYWRGELSMRICWLDKKKVSAVRNKRCLYSAGVCKAGLCCTRIVILWIITYLLFQSPEFFYSSVEKLISSNLDGADSVFEVLLFTDELEKLRK